MLLLPDGASFHEPCPCCSGLVQQSRMEQHRPKDVLSMAEYHREFAASWTFHTHEAGAGLGARRSCAASFLPQMDARVLFVRSMFVGSQEQRVWTGAWALTQGCSAAEGTFTDTGSWRMAGNAGCYTHSHPPVC